MVATVLPLLILLGLLDSPASAQNWPQWRGPDGDGVSDATGLPARFGPEENVRFKAPIDGLGTSTPVVWEDLVFVTSQLGMGPVDGRGAEFPDAVAARDYRSGLSKVRFLVTAFSRRDGRRVWQYLFDSSEETSALPAVHPKHNLASPSVVTDGERVIAWTGTGRLVALTMSGELLWERHLGREIAPFDVLWGHGSSPVLYRDTVLLLCDHPPGAYLLALDKRSGEELWRVDRGEGLRSYSTPFLAAGPSGEELVVNSSHRIEAYDPDEGELLWWAGDAVTLAIAMPVTEDGVLYASRGYSSGPYSAVRLGGRGDVSESHVLWRVPTGAPYISSFVLYRDRLYMATERGIATAIDPATGEAVWRERLGGAFSASPVAGDGKVYLVNEAGDVFVLAAGDAPEILARNPMGERMLASPAIAHRTLFLRSDAHVIAIGVD